MVLEWKAYPQSQAQLLLLFCSAAKGVTAPVAHRETYLLAEACVALLPR
jgi:hypothetical protein